MNSEVLAILDGALRWALLGFLGSFLLLALYSFVRLRRRRGTAEILQEMESNLATEGPPRPRPAPRRLDWGRPVGVSLLLAGGVGLITFLLAAFAPLPFLDNFATGEAWKQTPLRVTALDYRRFHEGFELRGQVWNQSEDPISAIAVRIEVLDSEREVLETVEAELEPDTLIPASEGRFEVRYTENSPLIYGYRLEFQDAEGARIPHVEGFEVR